MRRFCAKGSVRYSVWRGLHDVAKSAPPPELPASADVVVIGGGSAGCHTLYHLTKRGVNAVLLERAKLTAGTTWHTAGLVWRLRPNDVDIELLNNSRRMLQQLETETGMNPGWIENGGIFIAHTKTRLDEYRRLATIGAALGIENSVLSPKETQKLFPLLDPASFMAALHSPGDGVVDPAMLCAALTRAATKNGGKVYENCPVTGFNFETSGDYQRLVGVETPFGLIRTRNVVNATGAWAQQLVGRYGCQLPLIPMKHAYIVSESIAGVRGLPNVRDHDYSIYLRIQGDAICMGGYEPNPILLDEPLSEDFNFGLYDLDWSVFETHLQGASQLCPPFGACGIKSTICGPESFTPDHKPLMGPDPTLVGLYHNCGFNSAGMMFGGGCAEQLAHWLIAGQPELPMFSFDLRRFTAAQCAANPWIREKSHESYVRNYGLVFKHDQPLAGRNFEQSALHDELLQRGAFMEEKQGWERPAYFLTTKFDTSKHHCVLPYDWYGSYGHKRHEPYGYESLLAGDLEYDRLSAYHELIGEEALACRNEAVVFDMCYFSKLYLEGPDAQEAADWLFTANTRRAANKLVYTCMLNNAGGVEADATVVRLRPEPDPCFYIVSGGAAGYYVYTKLQAELRKRRFRARLRDVTRDVGIISIQGPLSRRILQRIVDLPLSDATLPAGGVLKMPCAGIDDVRVLRVSFVGELGYELHLPKTHCVSVYRALMAAGIPEGLRNAGYRALYALSSEKGYHLWNFDLRSNDTPLEAGLGFTCRKEGEYLGQQAVAAQRRLGIKRRLVHLTLDEPVALWGLEGVYRNGEPVGFVRRAEFAYALGKPIAQAYLTRSDGGTITSDFLSTGAYELEVLGKRHKANCSSRSPFDPEGKRLRGIYNAE